MRSGLTNQCARVYMIAGPLEPDALQKEALPILRADHSSEDVWSICLSLRNGHGLMRERRLWHGIRDSRACTMHSC
jgi:hypothetical protein